jgi:hypothetical protein
MLLSHPLPPPPSAHHAGCAHPLHSTQHSTVNINCQLCNQHRYLRELGIKDVEFVNIDYHDKKEHKAPEYLKVNYQKC